ncbi:DUF4214 domain-containing protein [Iamia majanohamensis]|uniref:DUF4214 domain-containing protein n=1 Tax=Iamia majanohamensis TaxID=467976 RepID=A0AAE9Y6R7_9ACTN|nr:DUF4214 domain-containing protein [Iamia majanohamensis]WCO65368.1 DUF4214 domain-containing protein [Iamia majanohamensis]
MPLPTRPLRRSLAVGATVVAVVVALVLGVAPAGADPRTDAAYADAAHRSLVGRPATAQESAAWVAHIGAGGSRGSLVVPLAGSEELEAQLVEAEYQGILGRSADAGGGAFWLDYLQRPGATLRSFEARLLGSPEFARRAGPTSEDLVVALYDVILRRAPSDADVTYWTGRIDGGANPVIVARGFLGSREARALDVRLAYEGFLGRAVDAGGLALWIDRLGATGDEQLLWASLVVSREYYDKVPAADRARTVPVAVPVSLALGQG